MKKYLIYILSAIILLAVIIVAYTFFEKDTRDSYIASHNKSGVNGEISINYPLSNSIFPPDIASPTFQWKDSDPDMDNWLCYVKVDGKTEFISNFVDESKWKPDSLEWEKIKELAYGKKAEINIISINKKESGKIYNSGKLTFEISKDSVSAPIFFRAVPLPFGYAVENLSTISWRLGSVSHYYQPKILLTNFPVCGNCHSFSSDAKVMSMDIDYANDKGSYFISPMTKNTDITFDKIITWSDYKREEKELTFGLLSQISPDGKNILSTVKDRSIFVKINELEYSQLFFPIKGILACYNRETQEFNSLPGADDRKYCQSNPIWSPDGKTILFTRSPSLIIPEAEKSKAAILPTEFAKNFIDGTQDYKFDIYKIPFNNGQGGTAVPLKGASHNGMSNFFPKYSPDGKWIVFCQAKNFMLLQPDANLYIMPSEGGTPRLMNCNNKGTMNSWHSWSPNGKWLVFSSKAKGPYTQLYLTHIDENGIDSPAILLENLMIKNRAANIPEFVNTKYENMDKIVEKFIDNDNYAIARGNEKIKLGDFKGALAELDKAIKLNPKDEIAYTRRGVINFELGRLPQAIQDFNKVIELSPESFFAYHNRAALKSKTNDFIGAIADYDHAIKLNPKSSEEYYRRGEAKFNAKMFREALSDFDIAIKLNSKNADYFVLRGSNKYNLGDFTSALKDFDEAIKLNSSDGNFYFKRAITKMQLDMNDDALKDLRESAKLGNKEAEQYIMNFF